MAIEKAEGTVVQSAQVIGGGATLLSLPDLDRLMASVRNQVAQLQEQRDQLTQNVAKLETELAAQRAAAIQLEADRDKYREMARVFGGIVFPADEMIKDLENMPPFEELRSTEELLEELVSLQRTTAVEKSA